MWRQKWKKRELLDTNFEIRKPCRHFDWMFLSSSFALMKTYIQSKHWQGLLISRLVSENSLFCSCRSQLTSNHFNVKTIIAHNLTKQSHLVFYMKASVHGSDHNAVVKIIELLSWVLWGQCGARSSYNMHLLIIEWVRTSNWHSFM